MKKGLFYQGLDEMDNNLYFTGPQLLGTQ